jgi:HSP90 family molecular chaperone
MQMIEERADLSLTNQFDVIFFSAFLISDRIVVTSNTMMINTSREAKQVKVLQL